MINSLFAWIKLRAFRYPTTLALSVTPDTAFGRGITYGLGGANASPSEIIFRIISKLDSVLCLAVKLSVLGSTSFNCTT